MTAAISPFATSLARIGCDAGRVILDHYARGVVARAKADASPVTHADEDAEALIIARLRELAPDIPAIAEEAMAAGEIPPTLGARFFLVDALDGTKEFLAGNGEFTVNIALIENGAPALGIVLAPALSVLFIGDARDGAFEIAAPADSPLDFSGARAIRARPAPGDGLVAAVSRTHRDKKTEEYLAHYRIKRMIASGSSLKFCMVAKGDADIYPRHGRTMEWDTAAGHAVLQAAGGSVTKLDGSPFTYGKASENFANPHFIARGRA